MSLLNAIKHQPKDAVALCAGHQSMSYQVLTRAVEQLSQWLIGQQINHVVLIEDNSIAWVLVDLACQHAKVCLTPVPTFFSLAQQQHVLQSVQADLVIANNGYTLNQVDDFPLAELNAYRVEQAQQALIPQGTSKITFTSGSTGAPKGVCLSIANQLHVADALVERIDIAKPRHLSLLPFSLLLENIAGIYAPLLAGGTVIIANDYQRGFNGCQLQSPERLLTLLNEVQPQSIILVPELLLLLVNAVSKGWQVPKSLEFIAVGGSRTSASLLRNARNIGLPVYQGYGLSECASVVSLQAADDFDFETIGTLLSHVNAEIEDGELRVSGNSFLGYVNQPESWYPTSVATGDLVDITANKLYFHGRKKHVLVNSFGRNISPEWLETELYATGLFQQVMVVGDSKPYCVALAVPVQRDVEPSVINYALAVINQQLPQYAQIHTIHCLPNAFSVEDDLLTSNGKLKRDNILKFYQHTIASLYLDEALKPVATGADASVTQAYQ